MYILGLQLFSAFLQMSLQQRLNLLGLQVGLIFVAEKLSLVFYPALGLYGLFGTLARVKTSFARNERYIFCIEKLVSKTACETG